MTEAAVAAKVHQALDVHGDFTAQVALDRELGHALTQTLHFSLGQVLDFRRPGNASRVANLPGRGPADAVNGGQRNNRVLMIRDINPSNTSHSQSSERKTKNYNTSTRLWVDSDKTCRCAALNPGAACGADHHRSRAPRPCGAQPCTYGTFSLQKPA